MPKHPFLSPEWIEAARDIRDRLGADAAPPGASIRMNQIITEVPFGGGTIDAHLDTSGGQIEMELGHLDDAEVTITLDYATAKAIFVEANPQAGMQAFMAGRIKVQGDMTKLMAMGQTVSAPDPATMAVQQALQDITE